MGEQNFSKSLQERVKTAIKSLNLDQQQLAEKLGLTQAAVSKALNGKSDRSFQRLLVLLSTEYGVSFDAVPKAVENEDLEAIRNELKESKQGIEELKEMFGRFEK